MVILRFIINYLCNYKINMNKQINMNALNGVELYSYRFSYFFKF